MILWYDHPHGKSNFGDELSRLLLPALDVDITLTDDPRKAELVAIGGNLEMLLPSQQTIVVGTGFIQDGSKIPKVNWDIRLIRGKLSAKRLGWKGPLGDPAVLAPMLLKNNPKVKWPLGIIPHVHGDENFKQFTPKGAKYIDLTKDPITILKEIASCEAVASSSVHGWLVAVALGIPAKRFELGPTPGGDYRWEDVCSGLDLKTPTTSDPFFTADLSKHQKRIRKILESLKK